MELRISNNVKSVRTRRGDVFSVKLSGGHTRYFQYIANDMSQLNSDVIRAFKKKYPLRSKPDLREVVSDRVDFHAHVVVPWGVKAKLWKKEGNVPFAEKPEVWFRKSRDYGNPEIKVSQHWEIWQINEKRKYIGKLKKQYQTAEIGCVVTPEDIVDRLRTGKYHFFYPRPVFASQ